MKKTILGVQQINFTNDKTGEVIDGVKLHLVSQKDNEYIFGHSVSTQFFTKKRFMANVKVGDASQLIGKTINLEYNERGQIDDFEIINAPAK